MIDARRRFIFYFRVHEKFFASKVSLKDFFLLVKYKCLKKNLSSCLFIKEKRLTLLTNLTIEPDVIFSRFTSTVRNEIRKSIKDGVTCCRFYDVEEYLSFFNDFVKEKHINTDNKQRVLSYDAEHFYMFAAFKDNQMLAIHSVLVDKDSASAMLLTSANVRFIDASERKIKGNVNKQLHFFELKYLKSMGIEMYDWGGIGTPKDIAENPGISGINEFKMAFGGDITEQFVYVSPLYWLLHYVAKWLGVIKSNTLLQHEKERYEKN
jgi:lipid II:glycine glycyltransferase (peptidoglycan interpeptide bridge formation enzyme)